MSGRDYKPSPEKPKNVKKGSPLLTGLLIGILLGVAASLGVVMFIKGGTSPFTDQAAPEKALSERILDSSKTNADSTASPTENTKAENLAAESTDDKTRFDFYTILPDSESKVSADEEKNSKQMNSNR